MTLKQLIVNADDFGQSKGINKGIIKSHENGIVTSASLMVRYNAATEAVTYAKANRSLSVGLHLDLGEWICNGGNWEMRYSVVDLEDIVAVQCEINNQVSRFFELMGRAPTHIDSHQHAHLNASILPIVEGVARSLNVTLRSRSSKVVYCGSFYGQSDDGNPHHEIITVAGLRRIISELPDSQIVELGCHPALDDDVETMYRIERTIEVETLCNKSLRHDLEMLGFELFSFEGLSF